jgi:RND family efflux transporter MFP subunit
VQSTVEAVPKAVEEGRAVRKGQRLATLDASDFIAQRDAAKAQIAELRDELALLEIRQEKLTERRELQQEDVALARKDLKRLKRLQKNDAANQREVDDTRRALIAARQGLVETEQSLAQIPRQRQQVKARIRSQRATLTQAKLNVQRTKITSPIAGVLEAVDIEPGESISPGQRVARVVSLERLEVPVQLPAAARTRLETGTQVKLQTTDGEPQTFTGTLKRIGPVHDLEARSVTAYIELTNQPAAPPRDKRSNLARPGMFLEAVVTSAQEKRHWALPRRAIQGGTIRTVQDGRVTSAPIELVFSFETKLNAFDLPQQRQWAAVRGDLKPGQPILVNAASSVLDGAKVEPVPAGQTTQSDAATMPANQNERRQSSSKDSDSPARGARNEVNSAPRQQEVDL